MPNTASKNTTKAKAATSKKTVSGSSSKRQAKQQAVGKNPLRPSQVQNTYSDEQSLISAHQKDPVQRGVRTLSPNAEQEAEAARVKAMEEELERLRAQVKSQVNNAPQEKKKVCMIPKPPGEYGKDYQLIVAMGLESNKPKYTCILKQPPEKKIYVLLKARKIEPYLKRFNGDWATADIMKQALHSFRFSSRRQDTNNSDDNGEDGEDEEEPENSDEEEENVEYQSECDEED
ncbi:hypothetical protein M422DRAFT_48306 [Sphaerobolus stellatus SS14]|uniref:Uncharacterized protein n=1 Tax=Sphaerobolus stellatus (strain SS14) TaxID=990650 RepID=A0A0C9VKS8_SPHS4|nr:hypothetical protein M422DRAFT_48306 [Sphaerobolus stellatus SS14]